MKYPIIVMVALLAVALVACGNRGARRGVAVAGAVAEAPVRYGYKIVNAYPHDPEAYTQGLFWYEGAMWESTGEYGHSSLREVALETGGVIRRTTLSDDYFAEGAVELGGKVYQLTWLEGTCFVYNAATMAPESTFSYKGEGWGLATDGRKLYMSDGTPNITVRSAETFAPERTIVVRSGGRPVQYINELEWIDGRLWANVYLTNNILIIDPESGRVEGIIDFSGIASQLAITPSTDVMNGIAYAPESGRIFVTGKRWNRLFEVEIIRQ